MLKVHVGGNEFLCPSYASAQRLACWFREELHEVRFVCMRCERTAALPASYAERLPPDCRLFDASGPYVRFADPWHAIGSPSWPHPRWLCDECFWPYVATLIPIPRR
jgi:hypothetical protein